MDKKKESRVDVNDLPRAEKELSAEDAKNVQGGTDSRAGVGILKSTDGGQTWADTNSGRIGSVAVDPSDPSGST